MSSRERHASAGSTATVAAPPPKHNASAVPLRSASATEAALPVASHWEALYRSVSPAEQADLLTLARRQGLLYSHQLPPAPPASRALPPVEHPRTWTRP